MSPDSCFMGIFSPTKTRAAPSVPGFVLVEDAVTAEEERKLLTAVDNDPAPWSRRRTRVTKNYGPYYLYTERDTAEGRFRYTDGRVLSTPLPKFMQRLVMPILHRAVPLLWDFRPNQLHVALYRPGDDAKIRMHNDNKMGQIGPYIVGICLGAGCDMTFVRPKDGRKKIVHLPRRCVYVMTGESHREWRHGILSGQTEANRVSFTLREVYQLAVEEGVQVKKSSHKPSKKSIAEQRARDASRLRGRVHQLDIKLAEQIDI